jgi:ubiquinone/menaquinone biosynthesis C-methylase UbiE
MCDLHRRSLSDQVNPSGGKRENEHPSTAHSASLDIRQFCGKISIIAQLGGVVQYLWGEDSMTTNDSNDSKTLSRERFSRVAQAYVTSTSHAKGSDLETMVEFARPQDDWRVLDIATGGGHTALKFAPLVAEVVATDLTPAMLDAARAFIVDKGVENVTFREADAENLPFGDESFDLVTCRIAPHHFPLAGRFVDEAARVLKSGGLLVMQDHVLPADEIAARYVDAFERLRDPSHNRAFSEREWTDMFEEARLTVEATTQLVKRHDFFPWAERQGNTPETIAELAEMMAVAPPIATEWLAPRDFGTPAASFANHHIIIAGRKGL